MYFRTCETCGATLDPGERCTDCVERSKTSGIEQFKKNLKEQLFENDTKMYGSQTENRRKYVSV